MPQTLNKSKNELTIIPRLQLSRSPVFSRSSDTYDVKFYGNIYNLDTAKEFDFSRFDKQRFIELLNNISGFFLVIFEDKTTGIKYLANDIFGNFRVYHYEDKSALWISDDWQKIVNKVKDDHGKLVIDENEKYYFSRHNYTSGGRTFVKYVDKMLPASLYMFNIEGIRKDIYFKSGLEKLSDDSYYKKKNCEFIMENIRQGLNPDYKNIISFSGGIDSTFMAVAMQKMRIPFKAIFMRYTPANKLSVIDSYKAQAVAKYLGFNVEFFEVPVTKHFDIMNQIVRRHLFDKGLSIPQYLVLEMLQKRYGPCNIINGTSSDSIYCWGLSGKTIGCFIQRFIASQNYSSCSLLVRFLISKAVKLIYQIKWRMNSGFEIPVKFSDYWSGLLDPQGYLPVIHSGSRKREYRDYITEIAQYITGFLNNDPEAVRMYMKMMFLQATVNISVIESTREYGHNPVVPFVDARIAYLKMRYQDEFRNLIRPRYVMEETLQDYFNFDVSIINNCYKQRVSQDATRGFKQMEKDVYKQWDQISSGLL